MPLTRLNNSAFDAQLEGLYFGMWNGSTPVRCFVLHEALTDKVQGSGQTESLDVFHEYRSEIEDLASAKYDACRKGAIHPITRSPRQRGARNMPANSDGYPTDS